MKRFRSLLLVLMLLISSSAMWAHDFEVNGIYYNITSSEDKTVEVTYKGESDDSYSGEYIGAVIVPETITYDEVLYNVTSIGNFAFDCCSGMTSITIPGSVTTIGYNAFYNCSGLTSIVVKEGNKYYDSRNNCNAIIETETNCLIVGCKNTIIPNSVTSIGDWAFVGRSGLTSITIPESVTSIGNYAFCACGDLTFITLPNSITSIGNSAFYGCTGLTSITIPESVTYIGNENVFGCCSDLTSIIVEEGNKYYDSRNNCNAIIEKETNTLITGCKNTIIPKSVTSIGNSAFIFCNNLTSIMLPDGITSIGNSAFSGCSGLTSITIPDGITSIGTYAFYGCSGLTSITFPESLTTIGDEAFSFCSGLTSIVVKEGNEYYDSRNNCNAIIETKTNTLIAGCKNTIIPNGVTSIGNSAFRGRSGMTSITLPASLTSIGELAFSLCIGLTSITIPESVTSIGDWAFNIYTLQSVKMLSSIPPAASEHIFDGDPETLVIYVPTGAAANYDVAPWNKYQIVEESSGMEDYAIWASDMRTRPTKPITLSVQLNNVNAISDYQFDLTLPKGFSIAMDEDDLEMIYLSTERTTERKHTYSYNMLSDSLLRVICYSNSTYTFSGNEGEVLTITLDVTADVADGDYNLMIKNIEMTEPDGTAHKASDYPCKVTVISYTPGDTNNDGNFSVTDVRGIVNMVLAAQVPDDNLAGDVNEDGVLSVTDVRGVVNLVLNPVTPTKLLSSKMRSATSSANLLYIDPFTIAPGEEKEVLVMLNNPDDAFSDIQFDLYLPEGIEVVNDNEGYLIGLGSRTDLRNHNRPEVALQRDGAVRVLCYSDKAETFFGHSGDVMKLTLKASDNLPAGLYNLQLKNVELARPDMTNDRPQASTTSVSVNGNATGIGSLDAEMERGEVYDLNGRPVQQPAKGVYIINGKKVIIK